MKSNRYRTPGSAGENLIGLLIVLNLIFWIGFASVCLVRWIKQSRPASPTVAAIRELVTH